MVKSLRLGGLAVALVGLFVLTGKVDATPTSVSLDASFKNGATITAGSPTVQTAVLTVTTTQPNLVDEVNIIVNYPVTGQPNLSRGYFQWTAANGFRKLGGANYGAVFVNFLPFNAINPTAGSQRIIDSVRGTVTFVFRWTTNASYGNIADNDIWFHLAERTTGYVHPWTKHDTSFRVVSPYTPPQFMSMTVDKQLMMANSFDVQTASTTIAGPVDEVNLIVNYPVANQPNLARGYFQWTAANGFRKLGGVNYGAQHVNLLNTSRVWTNYPQIGQTTFVFKWTANPSYGTIADNDVWYHFADRSHGYVHSWTAVQTNFAVGFVIVPPPTSGPVGVAVRLDAASPSARQYAAGSTGVTLDVLNFVASSTGPGEDVALTSLNVTQNVTDPSQASYPDYSLLYLVDAAGNTVASAVPTSTSVYFQLNSGAVIIPVNNTAGVSLTLKANLSNIGPQFPVHVGGHILGYGIASPFHMQAVGMVTATPVYVYYSPATWPIWLGRHIMYKGIPTVNILTPASAHLSTVTDLYKFQVSAGSSDIGLYKFTAHVGMVGGVRMSDVELYDATNPNEVLLYSASTLGRSNDFVEDMYLDAAGLGRRTEVTVGAGQTRTFVLRGRFGGIVPGSAVSTTFFGDAAGAGYTPLMQPAETINQSAENDFIWSDRHAWSLPHSTLTADWTNGYLVQGLNAISAPIRTISY